MNAVAGQHRLRWVVLGAVSTFALIGLFFTLLVAVAVRGAQRAAPDRWGETVVVPGDERKIAMVTVEGQIVSAFDPFSGNATDTAVISQIEQALDDPKVVGVMIRLNTPGGGVVASDLISRKVREADKVKPTIALMDDTAASGGYYIASSARQIIANPATITGSIGVIMLVPNVTEAAGKLGIEPMIIKSGPFKDIASPFRDMTPQDREILQKVIDEAYDQFVSTVANGRKLDPAKVRGLADGRIYTGRQAKDLGLVDELGDQELALDRLRSLAKAPKATLVRYERTGFLSALLRATGGLARRNVVEDTLGVDPKPGLKYLWTP